MHTPTQKQWATVIEKLYSVLPFALQEGSGLDMGQSEVNRGWHACGTTHCVAGWYAVAHWKDAAFDNTVRLHYQHGADQLASDLGFKYRCDLVEWADKNFEIWGNVFGRNMFQISLAYTRKRKGVKDLTDVIRHFEFVADNCKKVKR